MGTVLTEGSQPTRPREELARLAAELRQRHFGSRPLLLANVWDAGSAMAVVRAGHPVVATSSAAVAASRGKADHEQMPIEVAFEAISQVARAVEVPVTADVEAGYGLAPAELSGRLLNAGAVGCNLEDTDHRTGQLLDADAQAERINLLSQAAEQEGVRLVINARIDAYLRETVPEGQRTEEAIRRGRLYLAAGATCVYPIGLDDKDEIALLVRELAAPINVWWRHGSASLQELEEVGVARISIAAGLYRAAMGRVTELAAQMLQGDTTGL